MQAGSGRDAGASDECVLSGLLTMTSHIQPQRHCAYRLMIPAKNSPGDEFVTCTGCRARTVVSVEPSATTPNTKCRCVAGEHVSQHSLHEAVMPF
jgi:hypothetical protein